MTPSKYQEAIFRFVETGSGDGVVRAVAGSGKTTTLVEVAKRLPYSTRQRSVFLAFNKSIAEELSRRLPEGVQAATLHSMGYNALREFLGVRGRWDVDGNKYSKLATKIFDGDPPVEFTVGDYGSRPTDRSEAIAGLADLTEKAMLTLTPGHQEAALLALCAHFALEVPYIEWALRKVPRLLAMGADCVQTTISYTDMIYQCITLRVKPPTYEFVMVDESQDLNALQREFVLQMRAPGGRMLFVGDPSQAIYGFAGADCHSIDRIIEATNATLLPLDICYRCPKSHIALAKAIVPHIEHHVDAADGVTGVVNRTDLVSFVQTGDLVICRCVAPLIGAALELIRAGIGARVRGRDIGKTLTKVIDEVSKARDFEWTSFDAALTAYEGRMLEYLRKKDGTDMQILMLTDKVDAIRAVYEEGLAHNSLHSPGDLRARIEDIFTDAHAQVNLSSVHKAKGLEADRVLILDEHLMPHPMARLGWQVEQELNLRYVALTRSKAELHTIMDDRKVGAPMAKKE